MAEARAGGAVVNDEEQGPTQESAGNVGQNDEIAKTNAKWLCGCIVFLVGVGVSASYLQSVIGNFSMFVFILGGVALCVCVCICSLSSPDSTDNDNRGDGFVRLLVCLMFWFFLAGVLLFLLAQTGPIDRSRLFLEHSHVACDKSGVVGAPYVVVFLSSTIFELFGMAIALRKGRNRYIERNATEMNSLFHLLEGKCSLGGIFFGYQMLSAGIQLLNIVATHGYHYGGRRTGVLNLCFVLTNSGATLTLTQMLGMVIADSVLDGYSSNVEETTSQERDTNASACVQSQPQHALLENTQKDRSTSVNSEPPDISFGPLRLVVQCQGFLSLLSFTVLCALPTAALLLWIACGLATCVLPWILAAGLSLWLLSRCCESCGGVSPITYALQVLRVKTKRRVFFTRLFCIFAMVVTIITSANYFLLWSSGTASWWGLFRTELFDTRNTETFFDCAMDKYQVVLNIMALL